MSWKQVIITATCIIVHSSAGNNIIKTEEYPEYLNENFHKITINSPEVNDQVHDNISNETLISQEIIDFTPIESFIKNQLNLTENKEIHPDLGLKVSELLAKYGYPFEQYTIQTEDNYLVTLHRIPHGKNKSYEMNKPAVFLMHGMLCSSANWVLMGPERGLAYLLADQGYDVWMGNARGNSYSRKHVTLDPDLDMSFWKFSWHEIGYYDLPAMIDFVLHTTKNEKLHFIGHSQGTTVFFVLASERPEYNAKIHVMVGLAPIAYTKNVPNIIFKTVAQFYSVIDWITSLFGQYEFLPSREFIKLFSRNMCNDDSVWQNVCSNIFFIISGFDEEQLNTTMIPVILDHYPAGSSTREFLHYIQGINSGEFRQYDHGWMGNLIHYNTFTPPKYDLQKITTPVVLFTGQNDLLAGQEDIDKLHSELPAHSVYKHQVGFEKFSHLDFLWATDVVDLLYNKVFDVLKRFN